MWAVHGRAVERLGTVGGRAGVDALSAVLGRRSLWSPFRMRSLHRLAVDSLASIGTPEAIGVTHTAAESGTRAVRAAARARLEALAARHSERNVRHERRRPAHSGRRRRASVTSRPARSRCSSTRPTIRSWRGPWSNWSETLERAHAEAPDVVIGIVDRQVVVDGCRSPASTARRTPSIGFRAIGVERIAFDRGVTGEELLDFRPRPRSRPAEGRRRRRRRSLGAGVAAHSRRPAAAAAAGGRRRRATSAPCSATYQHAVAGAEAVWAQALAEGSPDPAWPRGWSTAWRSAVGQNRTGHDGADRAQQATTTTRSRTW